MQQACDIGGKLIPIGLTTMLLLSNLSVVEATSIDVRTDKTTYKIGEEVIIYGTVSPVTNGVVVQIPVYNPDNDLYTIDQVLPSTDGSFSTSIKFGGKLGISGIYTIKAIYGEVSSSTTIELTDGDVTDGTCPVGSCIVVEFEDDRFPVKYTLTNGRIRGVEVDPEFISIILSVLTSSTNSGSLSITLPRTLIDTGDKWIILADGHESSWVEVSFSTLTERTLNITIPAGTEEIEIIGSCILGQCRSTNAHMYLYGGVWDHDPIEIQIISSKQRYIDLTKEVLGSLSYLLKQNSGNENGWNFVISGNADIVVQFLENPDWCKSKTGTTFGYSDARGRVDSSKKLIKPVTDAIAVSCGNTTYSDAIISGTIYHEVIHSLGVGHAFNLNSDLMCSVEKGQPTCPIHENFPSQLNIDALLFIYGKDGFAEPNLISFPEPPEYRQGMIGEYGISSEPKVEPTPQPIPQPQPFSMPEILFDKEEYTPFDEVIVSIIYPDGNLDPNGAETIRTVVSSSSDSLGRYSFVETGLNTGIFEASFNLTPNKSLYPGDLLAVREDVVTVDFNQFKKSIYVNYHVGQVLFDKDVYRTDELGIIRVIDSDANLNPDKIDTVQVISKTDNSIIELLETGDRTGIFEAVVSFSGEDSIEGVVYVDNTLPSPAWLDINGVFTETEELYASAQIAGAIGRGWQKLDISEIEVWQDGKDTTRLKSEANVMIKTRIKSMEMIPQKFTLFIQVKYRDTTVFLHTFPNAVVEAGDTITLHQFFFPENQGLHKIEVYVWESVDNPVPLAPVKIRIG